MKRYPAALMTAALVGAALQLWCQSAAFDPFTGLVEPGAASALALWAFFIAVPVLALLSALPLRGRAVPGEGELYGDLGPVGRLLGAVSGGLVAVGAILELIPDLRALMAFPRPARLGSCAVDALLWAGGLCLLALTLRGDRPKPRSVAALIPGFGVCFWLVVFYHAETRDPVLERYVWTLLALMAAVLALYHQAAWAFGRPAPVRTQWFTMTAGVYAFAALPGAGELAEVLALAGLGGWMLVFSFRISALSAGAARPEADGPEPEGPGPATQGVAGSGN